MPIRLIMSCIIGLLKAKPLNTMFKIHFPIPISSVRHWSAHASMMSQGPPPSAASAHMLFYSPSPISENSEGKLKGSYKAKSKAITFLPYSESKVMYRHYVHYEICSIY